MDTTLIWGIIVMLGLGIVFGYMASGTWPKSAAAAARPAPKKRKAAAKRAPAKRKSSGRRGKGRSKK